MAHNKISVFFNGQYFINRLTSGFGFWNEDRHKRKNQRLLIGFLKMYHLGNKWVTLVLKMTHFHNSGIVRF